MQRMTVIPHGMFLFVLRVRSTPQRTVDKLARQNDILQQKLHQQLRSPHKKKSTFPQTGNGNFSEERFANSFSQSTWPKILNIMGLLIALV